MAMMGLRLRVMVTLVVAAGAAGVQGDSLTATPARSSHSTADHYGIQDVSFSPDGRLLASLDDVGRVQLWEVSTGRSIRRLGRRADRGRRVMFVAGGAELLTIDADGTVTWWDTETLQQLHGTRLPSCRAIAVSSDGDLVACNRGTPPEPTERMAIVDLSSGRVRAQFRAGDPSSLAFSPDHRIVAAGPDLWTWSARAKRALAGDASEFVNLISLEYSPDGRQLAAGGRGPELTLWDVKTARLVRRFGGHSDYIYSLAFSPDGATLYSGGRFSSIKAWSIRTGALRREFPREADSVVSMAVSPDGRRLAQGSSWRDGALVLWDAASGRQLWKRAIWAPLSERMR